MPPITSAADSGVSARRTAARIDGMVCRSSVACMVQFWLILGVSLRLSEELAYVRH